MVQTIKEHEKALEHQLFVLVEFDSVLFTPYIKRKLKYSLSIIFSVEVFGIVCVNIIMSGNLKVQ